MSKHKFERVPPLMYLKQRPESATGWRPADDESQGTLDRIHQKFVMVGTRALEVLDDTRGYSSIKAAKDVYVPPPGLTLRKEGCTALMDAFHGPDRGYPFRLTNDAGEVVEAYPGLFWWTAPECEYKRTIDRQRYQQALAAYSEAYLAHPTRAEIEATEHAHCVSNWTTDLDFKVNSALQAGAALAREAARAAALAAFWSVVKA